MGTSLATYRAGPYSVEVEARDRGSPPLKGRATVLVYLRDENNFAPAFVYPNAFNATAFVREVLTGNIGHYNTTSNAAILDNEEYTVLYIIIPHTNRVYPYVFYGVLLFMILIISTAASNLNVLELRPQDSDCEAIRTRRRLRIKRCCSLWALGGDLRTASAERVLHAALLARRTLG